MSKSTTVSSGEKLIKIKYRYLSSELNNLQVFLPFILSDPIIAYGSSLYYMLFLCPAFNHSQSWFLKPTLIVFWFFWCIFLFLVSRKQWIFLFQKWRIISIMSTKLIERTVMLLRNFKFPFTVAKPLFWNIRYKIKYAVDILKCLHMSIFWRFFEMTFNGQ